MTQESADVIESEKQMRRCTEPMPRNDCRDDLLEGNEGEGGRMNGDSSLCAGVSDAENLGDVDGVGVRVDDSEQASTSAVMEAIRKQQRLRSNR
jgi:hypothetical protein